MSIRNKLVLFSVGTIVLAVAAIGFIASWQFSNYAQQFDEFARQSFEKQAVLEIQRIDTVLSQFVSNGRRGAERLAKEPLLYEA